MDADEFEKIRCEPEAARSAVICVLRAVMEHGAEAVGTAMNLAGIAQLDYRADPEADLHLFTVTWAQSPGIAGAALRQALGLPFTDEHEQAVMAELGLAPTQAEPDPQQLGYRTLEIDWGRSGVRCNIAVAMENYVAGSDLPAVVLAGRVSIEEARYIDGVVRLAREAACHERAVRDIRVVDLGDVLQPVAAALATQAKADPFAAYIAGPQPVVEEPSDEIPPPNMESTMAELRRLGERTRVTTNEGARFGWGSYDDEVV